MIWYDHLVVSVWYLKCWATRKPVLICTLRICHVRSAEQCLSLLHLARRRRTSGFLVSKEEKIATWWVDVIKWVNNNNNHNLFLTNVYILTHTYLIHTYVSLSFSIYIYYTYIYQYWDWCSHLLEALLTQLGWCFLDFFSMDWWCSTLSKWDQLALDISIVEIECPFWGHAWHQVQVAYVQVPLTLHLRVVFYKRLAIQRTWT